MLLKDRGITEAVGLDRPVAAATMGEEGYTKASRSAALGKAAISTWAAPEETDRLTINESLYTPIGQYTATQRHLSTYEQPMC
jgi:hypothetical protein